MGQLGADNLADIVVGSGPSGVAAATALLERGRKVLLLDAGLQLEPEAAALRDRLGSTEPDRWSQADREQLGRTRRTEHSDSMRLFGSDFLFRAPEDERQWSMRSDVHSLRASFAQGGLSNGWGASVLPYRQADIADWPISSAELEPHYRYIAGAAGITNHDDALTKLFPVLADLPRRGLPPSRQASELLERLGRHAGRLAEQGAYAGSARHAVSEGCRTCGQCLHGCPYRLIFNASHALERLRPHPNLDYRSERTVSHFVEESEGVSVRWGDETLRGARLFVACGVLPTARLVLRSLEAFEQQVRLLDSALSYLPSLHYWSAGDPARESIHSLSQAFLEIIDPAVDAHTVHAQIYTWNDTFAADMRERFAPFASLAQPLIHVLSRRLLVAQTFLHSDSSDAIDLSLDRNGHLVASAAINPATRPTMARATRAVARVLRSAGAVALRQLQRNGVLGSSYHCGGTFPMRKNPAGLETNIWGRPAGLQRVHIVDASVFPSIPATTITYSVMANARRIAAGSPA